MADATAVGEEKELAVPKSFVFKYGKVTKVIGGLVADLRRTFEPNTAKHLNEKRFNKLKDFENIAGHLAVSHFFYVSQNDNGITHAKLFKFPRGPTLHFRLLAYSLIEDVQRSKAGPRSPGLEYAVAPIAVLSNFDDASKPHICLAKTFLENMYPAVQLETVRLAECRRIVYYEYDAVADVIYFRHYLITVKMVGVTRGIKNLLQKSQLPDMHAFGDISDYFAKQLYGEDSSEPEDAVDAATGEAVRNCVTLPDNYVGPGNKKSTQRKISLLEIGPRLKLELLRIKQDTGAILYEQPKEKLQ